MTLDFTVFVDKAGLELHTPYRNTSNTGTSFLNSSHVFYNV